MATLEFYGIDTTTGQLKRVTSSDQTTSGLKPVLSGAGSLAIDATHSTGNHHYALRSASTSGIGIIDITGVGGNEFRLKDSSAGTDEKNWRFINNSNTFALQVLTDAFASPVNVINITRSAGSPTLFDIPVAKARFGGASATDAQVVLLSPSSSLNALRVEGHASSTVPTAVIYSPVGIPPIRFPNLTSSSTTSSGLAPLGVDSTGQVKITTAPLYPNDAGVTIKLTGTTFDVDESYNYNWTGTHSLNIGTVAGKALHLIASNPATDQAKNSHYIQLSGVGRSFGVNTTSDWRLFTLTTTNNGDSNFVLQGGTNGTVSTKLTVLGVGGIRLPSISNSSPTIGDIWLDSTTGEFKGIAANGNTRNISSVVKTSSNFDISANTNNLNTSDYELVKINNLMGIDLDLTGITAGVDGQLKYISNVSSSNNVILKHNSTSSSVGNRFRCVGNADITLTLNKTVVAWYDNLIQCWRIS